MENTRPMTSFYKVILSPQGQITIPAEVRRLLRLKPGSNLSLAVKKLKKNVTAIVAYTIPKDPIEGYYGLGKKSYEKWGGADKVIAQERKSWKGR